MTDNSAETELPLADRLQKVVNVMKAARKSRDHMMNVWSTDLEAVEEALATIKAAATVSRDEVICIQEKAIDGKYRECIVAVRPRQERILKQFGFGLEERRKAKAELPAFIEAHKRTKADAILSLNPVGADALSSLLESGRQERDGWQLVPRKATPEMVRAAYDRLNDGTTNLYFKTWEAMLSAAPVSDQGSRHNEPVGHALSAETKSGDESSTREVEVLRKLAFGLSPASQYRLAFLVAENVGYILEREPPHPDCPHEREKERNHPTEDLSKEGVEG